MFLRQLYDTDLAQASYLIGCQATGDAIVVDPLRDIAPYLALAAAEGLRITAVTETHIHADFVSGARELAARVGATLYLSAEGGKDWQYRYATEAPIGRETIVLVRDGDRIAVGNVVLDVMHTPGHTPEHLSFVLTDTPSGVGPIGILSGDFVFAGDVGRPDLLERAAHMAGTMRSSAQALYHSLSRFRALPDHLQVWPGHGAGSACGKALGAIPASTVGYEKLSNWALAPATEEQFVTAVLAGQPDAPPYFGEMKRVNRDGPQPRQDAPDEHNARLLNADTISDLVARGAWLLDTRASSAFVNAFIPTAVSLPYGRSFTTWAGTVVPYDVDVVLLTDATTATHALRALSMIGFDRVLGWIPVDEAARAWVASGGTMGRIQRQDIRTLLTSQPQTLPVIDVRDAREWDAGHLPHARHVPLATITGAAGALPTGAFGVHCQSGTRSVIAASLLHRAGRHDVIDLTGGYAAWSRASAEGR